MPRPSSDSAGIAWLDRESRLRELAACARRLREAMPEVLRVLLFGSLTRGDAGPRSDADLLVVVSHSPHPRSRDRTPDALRALGDTPCPVDLFVVTEAELAASSDFGVARVALRDGVDLLPDA